MSRGALRTLAALLLLAWAPVAIAQVKDDLSITATIGWEGIVPGDRWAPITVYITTGEKAVEGRIVATFPQDPTQSAQITVPFAATPNRTTPVTLIAALPPRLDRLTLWVEMKNRRIPLEFTSAASRDTLRLPMVLDDTEAVVLAVGRTTLPEAMKDWGALTGVKVRRTGEDPTILEPVWGQMTPAHADLDALPTSWAAYQGLSAVVVPGDAATTVDRAALEAIQEWVLGGGRLVVLADSPGEQWRAWLPAAARDLMQADTPRIHPLPAAIAASVEQFEADLAKPIAALERIQVQRLKRPQNPYYNPAAPITQDSVQPSTAQLPVPAAQAAGRLLRLGENARRAGWTLQWTARDDPAAGMLAEGPVGFGHITIVGLEPTRATELVSTRASGPVWREALAPALADFLATAPWQDTGQSAGWYGRASASQSAINSLLERMAHIPGVGGWLVAAFAVGLVFLVALVGPVDYLVLKRLRAGQHWWLTALGWTTLACAVAWAAPALIRTSPTQIGRTSVVDCILSRGDASPGSALTAWSTGLTCVYAGESGLIRPRTDPASWWRGTAAVFFWYRSQSNGRGTAPTIQQAAGGAAGSARGNPLQPFGMPLWTFRSFLDDARAEISLGARVTLEGDKGRVLITGLPEGCRVAAALVRSGSESYACDSPALNGGAWSAPLRYSLRSEERPWNRDAADQLVRRVQYPPAQELFTPGSTFLLNGPSSRTPGAERLAATGHWAEILLQIDGWPPEPVIDRPAKSEHTRILRLLVPVERPDAPAPPDPTPPTPDAHPT